MATCEKEQAAVEKQLTVDAIMSDAFRERAGSEDTTSRAALYGYPSTQLMQEGAKKGIPATADALKMYAQRVLRPGQVQAFGVVMLVGSVASVGLTGASPGTILAVSANCEKLMGLRPEAVMDTNVFEESTSPFTIESIASLKLTIEAADLTAQTPLIMALSQRPGTRMCAVVHTTEEGIVLDLEPFVDVYDRMLEGNLHTQSLVKNGVARLQDASQAPPSVHMQLICDELRGLLHYDRVMMYQFHEDQHGEVMAESFSQFAKDAYMGLHFPSTDIPQANRAIFMAMRSRMIADVTAEASKVMQSARMNNDILLGGSQLRGMSGCHGQYLSNMGVKATLVLSIIVNETQAKVEVRSHGDDDDDTGWSFSRTRGHRRPRARPKEKLWGLIVCHHYQCPHRVAYYQRSAAEFLVRIFASQLGRTLQKEHQRLERSLLRQQAIICSCLKFVADAEAGDSSPDHIPKMIASVLCTKPGSTALPLVANATGAAIILGDTLGLVGNCPDIEEIRKLVVWMQSTGAARGLNEIGDTSTFSSGRRLPLGGMWSTHCLLNEGFPGAEALTDNASGILAFDVALLDLPRYDGRYGHVHGAPGSSVDAHTNVTPRTSQDSDRVNSEDAAGETMARSLDSAYSRESVQPAVLIWFRGESVAEEAWAGDVKGPQARHQGVEMSPRESFKAVRTTLRGQSVPWEPLEKNGAANMQHLFRDTMSSRKQGILSSSIMATLGQRNEINSGGLGCDNDGQFKAVAEKLRTIIGTADLPMIRVNSDSLISEHNSCAGLILVGANRSAVGLTLMDFLEPNSANIMEVTMRNVISEMIVPKPMLLRFKPPGAAGMSAVLQRMEARTRGDVDAFESNTCEMLVFWQLSSNATTGKLSGVVLTGRDMGTYNFIMHSLEFSNLAESADMGGSVQTSVYGDHHNPDPHGSISSIIANAVVPVASIDSSGRVEHWNTRMEFVTGLDRKQAEGQLLLGDLFGSKGGSLHILPSAAGTDPEAELTVQLMSVLNGGYGGPAVMSTTVEGIKSLLKTNRPLSTLEASGWDTPESASFADDDRRTRNLASMITAALPPRMAPLGQALNEHVSLRFVKAGIASTQHPSTSVASEAVDVIMDAIVFFQARPEHASCSSNINENDNGSSGSGNGGFVYLLDMSLPKALEKAVAIQLAAETAADAKSRHIAFMSHEIRNPVNGILASVEAIDDMLVLIRKPTDEQGDSQLAEVEDLVKTTLACTEQLRRTVDDILDFNKLEEGKLVLLKESFFLERMLRSVMMQVKSAAQVKGLKLLTQISPLLRHATLLGDVGRIQQVLTNFCWNAVKFTPKGSITIEVSCEVPEGGIIAANKVCTSSEAEANGIIETGETGGDSVGNSKDDAPLQSITLYFKVIDTGEGMSKATMENIFERFTMGEHKCGKYGGSGLGLTICRSLAELMQGEIHCMSTPAGGSTFVLELSLEIESTNEPQALASRVLDHGYPQSSALPPKEIKDMNESEAEVGEGAGITQEMCNGGGCVEPPGMARVKKPSFSSHSQRSISVEATAMISLDAEGNIELPRQFSRSPDTSKPEQSHDDGVSERARVAGKAARCSAYSHHEQSQSTQLPQSYLEQQHQEQPYQPGQWNEHSERIQAWQMRVVREQVEVSSVAVLVEVCTGQEVRQHWGGAPVGEGGIGPAMARAQEDGLARALWLFPPESGTLSSSRRIPAPSASRETGTWCSAACDVPNSQRSQPSRPVSRPSSSIPTSSTPTHDSSMNHAARHPAHRQGQDLPIIVSRPPSRPPSRPRTPPPTGAQNMPMREMSENKQAGGGALAGIGGVHSAETIPDTHSAKTGILPGAGSAGSLHGFDRSENQGKSATSATAGAAAKELAASSLSSVLVVDDDKINVKVLKRIFVKAEGIVVTTGEDGTDVVRLLVNQNLRFDAVLLDENMRHMNGSIATAELRKHEARKGEVMPQLVIATTGNFAAQDVYRYQKAGYNAMLIKPMNVKLLVKCVADYHAFWKHTAGAGTVWNPGQELPPECPAPDVRDTSFFVDGYFFGNLEVFGNIPRFY